MADTTIERDYGQSLTGLDGYTLLYVRISKEDRKKVEREGVDSQLFRLHQRCDERNIPKDRRIEFVDNDISASAFSRKERDDYKALTATIAASTNCLVLATEQQRLVRQLGEGEEFMKLMIRTGTKLNMLAMGDVDLTSDSGDFAWVMNLFASRMESQGLSRRLRTKNAAKREQGLMVTKGRAFGYADNTYTKFHAAEKAMLLKMVKAILAGQGVRDCQRMLTVNGFLSPRSGKPYTLTAVKYMLKNPVYAGYVVHNGEKGRMSTNVKPLLARDLAVAIARHEDVVATLAARAEHWRGKRATPTPYTNVRKHVLSGFLRCGKCGTPLKIGASDGQPAWRCPAKSEGGCAGISRSYTLVASVVDECIREQLTSARVDAVAGLNESAAAQSLAAEIEELELRVSGLGKLFADPRVDMSVGDYHATLTGLRDEVATRRTRLAGMVRAAERTLPPDALATWEDERPENLSTRRAMVATLIERIVCVPAGNHGRRGAPRDSVQVFPVKTARGRALPAMAEIAGADNAEELAS